MKNNLVSHEGMAPSSRELNEERSIKEFLTLDYITVMNYDCPVVE